MPTTTWLISAFLISRYLLVNLKKLEIKNWGLEMNDRQFYLTIAGLVLAAFLFRWDIQPTAGAEANAAMIVHKLDRKTGNSFSCVGFTGCSKHELEDF